MSSKTPQLSWTGLVLAGFNLRIGITTIGPVVGLIRIDTGMSSAVAGILTALPFLCMGAFALTGSGLARRLGFGRLVATSLALIAFGSLLRVARVDPVLLLLGTLPIGVGIAFIGVVLPGVVRRDFPATAGRTTGHYVAASCIGGAAAAILASPVAEQLGSWRWALAITAAPPLLALALWPWLGIKDPPRPSPVSRPARRPDRVALILGLAFGLETLCFAALMAWVSPLYDLGGWSSEAAASATALILLVVLAGSLIIPALSRAESRGSWLAGAAAVLTVGISGMAWMETSGGWLWLLLSGFGLGALFTLLLAAPVDLSADPHAATDLSGWMQGIGYTFAAIGPVLVGAMRDATGDFEAAFALLAVLATLSGALALAAIRVATAGRGSDRAAAKAR